MIVLFHFWLALFVVIYDWENHILLFWHRNTPHANYGDVNEYTLGGLDNKIHLTYIVPDDGRFLYIKSQQIYFSRDHSGDGEYPDKMD